ncbi:hypothetical protein HC766_01995 [Candidatus Gracilibacteria bacterium]|nr:hypothetical protein [Candidatus Gracilibacteria bacterium]NJS41136.1 hypothetical protein [Candidatus Gracilibacteria bacterium]
MPAHQTHLEVDERMLIRQRALVFLLSNGFLLIDNKRKLDDIGYDFVQIKDNIEAFQVLNEFADGVEFMEGMRKDLRKYSKSLGRIGLDFEWNYLGQNDERIMYIDYIERTFWCNQNNTQLQELVDFQSLVEQPWKLIRYHNLIEDFCIPADFFGSTTNGFVMKIQELLGNWRLNPFLILDTESNFQWAIHYEENMIIEGVIFKDKKSNIIHKYSFGLS